DGIRDKLVTGVQTCALPIFNASLCPTFGYRRLDIDGCSRVPRRHGRGIGARSIVPQHIKKRRVAAPGRDPCSRASKCEICAASRSEERRVGKECRGGWWRDM